ncbi:MAG: hypothetical protein HYY40_11035 [Bacteroidetes bacterium]|nr:hypothetical protein [Bacteroidota bacterium]
MYGIKNLLLFTPCTNNLPPPLAGQINAEITLKKFISENLLPMDIGMREKINHLNSNKNFLPKIAGRVFFSLLFIFSFFNPAIPQSPRWRVFNTTNSLLPDDQVKSIIIDREDTKWIGTAGGGLVKLTAGGKWTVYTSANSGLPDNFIDSISFDKSGTAWIASGSGVVKFEPGALSTADPKAGWTLFSSANSGLPFIRSILIDDAQNKWIGTLYGGLARMEPARIGSSHANWTIYANFNSRLPNNAVWPLAMDEDDNLWIGTRGGGLAKLIPGNARDNKPDEWIIFNSSNSGLPDNEVVSLKVAPGNIIWVGTVKGGAAQFNEKINQWKTFNTFNSGIPGEGTGCDELSTFNPDKPETWTISQFIRLVKRFSVLSSEHQKTVISQYNKYLTNNPKDVNALILYSDFAQIKGIVGLTRITEPGEIKPADDISVQIHAALDRALSVDPNNGDAYYRKSRQFSGSGVTAGKGKHDDHGNFSQAMQFARKAVNLAPDNALYREQLALLLVEERNFEEASAIMKPVIGGTHPLFRLISDFREFSVPQEAVFLKDETGALAAQLTDTGAIADYPGIRVHIYAIPYGVGDLELFFSKWFNEFVFFPVEKDRKNAISTYRQYVKFLDSRPFATSSKKELPSEITGGIELLVEQYIKTPGTKTPSFVNKLVEANPENGSLTDFCKLVFVNYRR